VIWTAPTPTGRVTVRHQLEAARSENIYTPAGATSIIKLQVNDQTRAITVELAICRVFDHSRAV
jgi:hypothetical protein